MHVFDAPHGLLFNLSLMLGRLRVDLGLFSFAFSCFFGALVFAPSLFCFLFWRRGQKTGEGRCRAEVCYASTMASILVHGSLRKNQDASGEAIPTHGPKRISVAAVAARTSLRWERAPGYFTRGLCTERPSISRSLPCTANAPPPGLHPPRLLTHHRQQQSSLLRPSPPRVRAPCDTHLVGHRREPFACLRRPCALFARVFESLRALACRAIVVSHHCRSLLAFARLFARCAPPPPPSLAEDAHLARLAPPQ